MRVTLVAGLPGSGKSHLLSEKADAGALTIDDISDLDALPDSPAPWLVIADVNFCIAEVREAAVAHLVQRYGSIEVDWIFYENNPDQCLANARGRDDGRDVDADIRILSRRYTIPADADVVPVYVQGCSPSHPQF